MINSYIIQKQKSDFRKVKADYFSFNVLTKEFKKNKVWYYYDKEKDMYIYKDNILKISYISFKFHQELLCKMSLKEKPLDYLYYDQFIFSFLIKESLKL